MRLVKPSYEIKWHMPPGQTLELLEWAGRKCWKSEAKVGPGTASVFVRNILSRNPPHESVIEHISASVLFIVDRGVSHELVRHRLGSYCLSGDTKVYFDLPSGQRNSRRRKYTVTIRDLYKRWTHGVACTARRSKKSAFADRIEPARVYSACELAKLTGRRRETISNTVRLGYLAGRVQPDCTTRSPNKKVTKILGADWLTYATRETTIVMPAQARIRAMRLRCCNEDTGEIAQTNIVNVTASGVKQVFRVTLDNGYQIKLSKDHRILTNSGWQRLEDAVCLTGLAAGSTWQSPQDLLIAVNGYPLGSRLNRVGNRRGMALTPAGRMHLKASKTGANNPRWKGGIATERQKIAGWTRSVAQRIHANFDYTCQLCGERGGRLEAHHLDPVYHNVSRAYDETNLLTVHDHCHQQLEAQNLELDLLAAVTDGGASCAFWQKHQGEKRPGASQKKAKRTTRLVRTWARIVQIDFVGEEDTYDIEVAGPFHNFVADGVIVHNSQESTRFCDYGDKHVVYILPPWITDLQPGLYDDERAFFVPGIAHANSKWAHSLFLSELTYQTLRADGWTPQQARAVLPNSLKTEIVATYNLRQWRHVFKMRTATNCHPQMLEVMRPLLADFQDELPELFGDL